MKRRIVPVLLSSILAFSVLGGCSSDAAEDAGESGGAVSSRSEFEISLAQYNAIYRTSFTRAEDAYKVNVTIGDKTIPAPTHLFGEAVNIIPYSNEEGAVRTADDVALSRGDEVIARVYKPGQVGIAVKHHRSEQPTLNLNGADAASMKEQFKLQDTHIEVVVGVERDGQDGAITLNNPQNYESGAFGNEHYAMVFLKPVYPAYLSANQTKAFEDNVRTMLVGFNAVTNFPGDYNGGDPLGARDPAKVREYVKQMVLAINGSEAARAWFAEPENMVYCAELAFLSFSAGLIAPLNDATMEPLVGAAEWTKFQSFIRQHNAGESTPFTALNSNVRVKYIRDLAVAPRDLKPAGTYGPAGEDEKLALQPLTMSDMIDDFMRVHVPREQLGEALAPAQAGVLAAMKPGLLEQMGMDQLPASDPKRVAVETLYGEIVRVVSKSYASYTDFRAALEPFLQQARAITGPRGDSGEGLFVPPSLFHVAAQGKHAGLLKFQYEGHGVHVSAVKRSVSPDATPTPVNQIASEVSCQGQCGGMAVGGCYCDARCATNPEGCCADAATLCTEPR